MQIDRYPKLGSTNRLYPRNQFGRSARRHTVMRCAACEREAVHKVTVQKSWFHGEDEMFLLCGNHKDMATFGKWAELYGDIKNAASTR